MASGEKRKHTTKDLDLCKWECAGYIYIQRCRIYRKEYQWFYSTVLRKLYDPHHNSSGTYSVLSFFWLFFVQNFWRQGRRFLRSRIRRRRSSSTSTAPAAPHEYKHITLWSICSFNIDHVDRGINQLWMSLTFFFFWWKSNDWATSKEEGKKRHGSSETTLSPRKAASIRIGPGWHWPISFVLFTQKRRKFALKVIK